MDERDWTEIEWDEKTMGTRAQYLENRNLLGWTDEQIGEQFRKDLEAARDFPNVPPGTIKEKLERLEGELRDQRAYADNRLNKVEKKLEGVCGHLFFVLCALFSFFCVIVWLVFRSV